MTSTQRHGTAVWLVNTTTSYSRGAWFKHQVGDRLLWPKFLVVFLNPSTPMLGKYLISAQDHFLPHHLQFMIVTSSGPIQSQLLTAPLNKLQIKRQRLPPVRLKWQVLGSYRRTHKFCAYSELLNQLNK